VLIEKSNLPLAAPQLTIQALDNIPLIPILVWFTFPIRLATCADEGHTLQNSDSSPQQKSTPVLVLRTHVFTFMDLTFVDCSTMRSTLSWFSHQLQRKEVLKELTKGCRTTRVHLGAACREYSPFCPARIMGSSKKKASPIQSVERGVVHVPPGPKRLPSRLRKRKASVRLLQHRHGIAPT